MESSHHPFEPLTDTDFAEDISLENAQSPLQTPEQTSNLVGFYLNESKSGMSTAGTAEPRKADFGLFFSIQKLLF